MSRQLRRKPRISYYEIEEPEMDEYVFCDDCADYVFEYCSIHGPLLVLPDDKECQKKCYLRFLISLYQHLGAGLGVFATLTLPKGVRFGPYRGERTKEANSDYCWQIYWGSAGRKPLCVVDAADANRSNWMRYVNCSRHCIEQNLLAYQYQGELYYRTIRIIPRGSELLVWYGAQFARSLGVNVRLYNKAEGCAAIIGASVASKPTLQNVMPETPGAVEKRELKKDDNQSNAELVDQDSQSKFDLNVAHNDVSESKPPKKKLRRTSISQRNNAKSKHKRSPKETNLTNSQANSDMKNTVSVNSTLHEIKATVVSAAEKNNNINCNKKIDVMTSMDHSLKTNHKTEQEITDKDTTDTNLDKHLKNRQTNEKCHVCEICNSNFTTQQYLVKHLRMHSGQSYSCKVCDKKFIDKSNLNLHIRIHTDEQPYPREICYKKFNQKANLNTHVRIHSGDKPYTCEFCNKKFNQKVTLNRHVRIHSGDKPYTCEFCNKKFNQKVTLNRHVRIHSGDKPYTCEFCNKKFNQKANLNRHVRIHSGDKPYTCEFCNKKFNQRASLNTHVRIHSGDKPYTCEFCNKKFNQKATLNAHVRIHTGQKPYSCDVCGKKFRHSNSLKAHLKTHT